ncbi:MAG: glycosyltransferase family 2 protein [Planctomycetota bacterium]
MTTAPIRPHTAGLASGRSDPGTPPEVARVTTVITTWNKPEDAALVAGAVARQEGCGAVVDLVIVDNASKPEHRARLLELVSPDAVVANRSSDPRKPDFARTPDRNARNGRVASITVVLNQENMGGCGGFNTGMRYAAARHRPDYVWLLDDDIDLPNVALARLLESAEDRPDAALFGSRTVDKRDRATTIETTIFLRLSDGLMGPDPDDSDPRADAHRVWRRSDRMTGLRDVDVVSACSMLARWPAVERVGFWDDRFFLYCDDADWCVRTARAGYGVVLNLDAVVYHTPWFEKLTPTRSYYAQRNQIWLIANGVGSPRLLVARRLLALLRDAVVSVRARDRDRSAMLLRAAEDAARGRGGKLVDLPSQERKALLAAFVRASLFGMLAIAAPSRLKGNV